MTNFSTTFLQTTSINDHILTVCAFSPIMLFQRISWQNKGLEPDSFFKATFLNLNFGIFCTVKIVSILTAALELNSGKAWKH